MSDERNERGAAEPADDSTPQTAAAGGSTRDASLHEAPWHAWRDRVLTACRQIAGWSVLTARRSVAVLVSLRHRVRGARAWPMLWSAARRSWRRLLPAVTFTGRVSVATLLIAGIVLGSGWLLLHRVEPTTIGVRQARWGGGIESRDYPTGLQFSVRPLHTWYELDARTRVIAFAHRSDGGSDPMLRVRTKDGNVARVAASVPYRIRPDEGHLLIGKGLRTTYPDLVRATVKKTLLVELAHLNSDDLCDPEMRIERVQATLPKLNQALAEYHVEAESIELRMVFFPQEYEQTLQTKQLSRQLKLLAEAEKELKNEELRVGQVEMEIEGEVQALHAQKKKDIAEIVARHKLEIGPNQHEIAATKKTRGAAADTEYAKLVAAGDIALHEAEAERTRLMAEAYGSPGGRLYLAREAAERLRVKEVTLNSNDPRVPSMLDLDELVRLFVGKAP